MDKNILKALGNKCLSISNNINIITSTKCNVIAQVGFGEGRVYADLTPTLCR